ncbi:MAG TPA: 50S ribosomal protein L3 [Actinomycetota bacterium]|nr:50S ribosomal protein L3 [Actinomycetota bacterium]
MAEAKGILGTKLGMTQIFTEDARAVPVTVIQAGPCFVTQVKTAERDGYGAVQLAFAEARKGRTSKPLEGHFKAAEVKPTRHLVELRTDGTERFQPGQEIKVDIFAPGEHTDVIGVSKGKGFAGTMKRHGFGGLGASHGTERKHRSPGAIGACATPSRVFKGTRMAGQMGNERVTVLNLEVVEADPERNLLLLKGAVPGPTGGLVMVRSSVKAGGAGRRAV